MRLTWKQSWTLLICLVTLFCAALFLGGLGGRPPEQAGERRPTVILISIDAFRADYLDKYAPANLTALAREGVRAKWMIPSYPSLTFPNHYTVATGLYPEHHGIVGNEMYDPVLRDTFTSNKRAAVQDGRWWGGEPIWVTAEKQGQRAACLFYPGSEAEISGKRPTFWNQYDGKLPDDERANTALKWLDLPASERPTFISLYFSDVDDAGHHFSPNSAELKEAINRVDHAIGILIQGLQQRRIFDRVNIIVFSDHGMAEVKPEDVVMLDESFKTNHAEEIVWGAELTQIFPKAGETGEIYRELSQSRLGHAHCYLKEQIPARFHYQNNVRIAPIVCMADEGWRMFSRVRYTAELKLHPNESGHLIGAHGYDNSLPEMRATFLARGPAIKQGVVVEPFENINVYDVMTKILNLNPAKNDGDPGIARQVLR